MLSTERIECLIDCNVYENVKKYTQRKIDFFHYYEQDIYNKENKKIGMLTIEPQMDMCILSFTIGDKCSKFMVGKVSELCGIYSLTYNGILYLMKLDKKVTFNMYSALSEFHIYHWKSTNKNMDFIINLTKYINLSDKFNMGILLYCLIISMEKIKEDLDLIKYIEEKFQYYGHNITIVNKSYKIDFEQKLNTNFSLKLEFNSNAYYEMFYELFKYLWNLKSIDVVNYGKKGLYTNILTYFRTFIRLLSDEGIIPMN